MQQFDWPDMTHPLSFDAWRLANPSADTINLAYHQELDDAFLETITGIKHINLRDCSGITDAGISKLKGIETLDISRTAVTDAIAPFLKGIKSISIQANNITDRALDEIDGVEYLDISSNANITDACFVHLKDIRILRIPGCINITDAGLANLNSIERLNISVCSKITNAGLVPLVGLVELVMRVCEQPTITDEVFAAFKNLKSLDITGCKQLTNGMFQYMPGVESLILGHVTISGVGLTNLVGLKRLEATFSYISDEAVASLRGLTYLDLSYAKQISDAALANLQGIKELYIEGCKSITDVGFASLDGIKLLNMTYCFQPTLTDAAFVHLAGIEKLVMVGCTQITDAALANLTGIKVLEVDGCSINLFGDNLQALRTAGTMIYGEAEQPDLPDEPEEPGEVSTDPEFAQQLRLYGTLSGREDLDIPLPDVKSYTDEFLAGFGVAKVPLPNEIGDLIHGKISFMQFVVLNSGSGVVVKINDSYNGISRGYISKEVESGNSTYYECSKKFTRYFDYSDIMKTPYFALKTPSGSLYIEMKDALIMLKQTHSFWELTDTEYTIAFSASRSAVIAGGPLMSADHCQGGTAKKIYQLVPIVFEMEEEEEAVPTTVGLKFGEERIEIPFVPTQTIDEVKAAITAKWPELTTDKQRLIYNGKPLETGTLGDAKVQPGFTIQIIKRGGRKTYRVKKNKTKKRPSN